jgi:hypothetical protein
MHKNATKCKQKTKQLVKNKHGASKNIDTFATYHLPTTAHLGRDTWADPTPLMTRPVVSFSVSSSSPIRAESPAARSSAPNLMGDLDGCPEEPPPRAPDRTGEAMEVPPCRTPRAQTAREDLAIKITPAADPHHPRE